MRGSNHDRTTHATAESLLEQVEPLDVRLPAELREQRIPRGPEHDTRLQHLTDEADG